MKPNYLLIPVAFILACAITYLIGQLKPDILLEIIGFILMAAVSCTIFYKKNQRISGTVAFASLILLLVIAFLRIQMPHISSLINVSFDWKCAIAFSESPPGPLEYGLQQGCVFWSFVLSYLIGVLLGPIVISVVRKLQDSE